MLGVDAVMKPKHLGERELASHHMLNVMPKNLVFLDRGYPAWWLFKLILSMKADFCARISYKKWKVVRKFYRSGMSEIIIRLPINTTSIARCREMGLDLDPLELRLVRIENNGNVQVLITSLTDTQKYPIELFSDLYHKRWPVEEDYKEIKCRLELENFTGKTSLSVYQDFHAKVFLKNLGNKSIEYKILAWPNPQTFLISRPIIRYCFSHERPESSINPHD